MHEISREGSSSLLYVDRHLVHEVTSPQAFEGLRMASRGVRRPDLTLATMDHNVPTRGGLPMADDTSASQMRALERNCAEFGIRLYGMGSPGRGIVHVIGPQTGFTLPGCTIVCGDSHTSTHGAFGALAFGIGTSDVEHVLATQTVWLEKPRTLEVRVSGAPGPGATAKDVMLYVIRRLGAGGGAGHVIEYTGDAIRSMGMDGRMTVCNMSIEAGARAGLISPDGTTYEYLRGRPMAPGDYEAAVAGWRAGLHTDPGAEFDRLLEVDVAGLEPQVSWGTTPEMTCGISDMVPDPAEFAAGDPAREAAARRALEYMDLEPGTRIRDIAVDRVFIGSCTNARLSDLREAARALRGGRVAPGVRAMVVPGSEEVRRQAEEEGISGIFEGAGFEWRESGCSMCLGMNPDVLGDGERCASTSNRNFEGRQGAGGRTHLVSPAVAARAAVRGRFEAP